VRPALNLDNQRPGSIIGNGSACEVLGLYTELTDAHIVVVPMAGFMN
jgi:hypothetical protein